MLSQKITKKIIEQIFNSTLGVVSKFSMSDLNIVNESNCVVININIKIDVSAVNVLETAKMVQKRIFYELSDKTDLKNLIINLLIN
ncbi:MAG: hypothetical protein HUJ42_03015 [Malacoplasma sp.]|mgnify:CR=1 FL=1|nr:hypothetical protein [Malacoplasma sp.]